MSYVQMEVEHLTHRDYKEGIKKVTHDKNLFYYDFYLQTFTVSITSNHSGDVKRCWRGGRERTISASSMVVCGTYGLFIVF